MIVVDLGCATHDGEESIGPLIDFYDPVDLFLGFDPWPGLVESSGMEDGTMVVLKRLAAWTENGTLPFVEEGLRSRLGEGEIDVPCFDLAQFLTGLPDDDLIVKFDVEGAEVPLLERLHETGMDGQIRECLVEWHDDKPYWPADYTARRERLESALRCPVGSWEGFGT